MPLELIKHSALLNPISLDQPEAKFKNIRHKYKVSIFRHILMRLTQAIEDVTNFKQDLFSNPKTYDSHIEFALKTKEKIAKQVWGQYSFTEASPIPHAIKNEIELAHFLKTVIEIPPTTMFRKLRFKSKSPLTSGVFDLSQHLETMPLQGAHAVNIVGYKTKETKISELIAINSWGTTKAGVSDLLDQGMFRITNNYLYHPEVNFRIYDFSDRFYSEVIKGLPIEKQIQLELNRIKKR